MAEKESCLDQDIEKQLKELDACVKIPEIPSVDTIFEKADANKNNVVSFKSVRYIAAAAVVLICIGVSLVAIGAKAGLPKSEDASNETAFRYLGIEESEDANGAESSLEGDAAGYAVSSESSIETAPAPEDGEDTGKEDNNEDWTIVADEALSVYFSNVSSENSELKESESERQKISSFTDKVSKKRSVDVEVSDNSVSIMLYDTSGEAEIISAFWVEGELLSSSVDDEYYILSIAKEITKEEFEEGDYMPYIGDAQSGTYAVSCTDMYVKAPITKAEINMSIKVNVEDGTYEVYASLE